MKCSYCNYTCGLGIVGHRFKKFCSRACVDAYDQDHPWTAWFWDEKGLSWPIILAIVIIVLLAGAFKAMAQDHSPQHQVSHVQGHDLYKTWKQPQKSSAGEDLSCCNDDDCEQADVKYLGKTAEFFYAPDPVNYPERSKWCPLPLSQYVTPQEKPPGSHVCYAPYAINAEGCPSIVYCWTLGEAY